MNEVSFSSVTIAKTIELADSMSGTHAARWSLEKSGSDGTITAVLNKAGKEIRHFIYLSTSSGNRIR